MPDCAGSGGFRAVGLVIAVILVGEETDAFYATVVVAPLTLAQ